MLRNESDLKVCLIKQESIVNKKKSVDIRCYHCEGDESKLVMICISEKYKKYDENHCYCRQYNFLTEFCPICGFTNQTKPNDSIPFRDVFKEEIDRCTECGVCLTGARLKVGITQKQLADKLGVSPQYVWKMEHGMRSINEKMARKLEAELNCDYRLFLTEKTKPKGEG